MTTDFALGIQPFVPNPLRQVVDSDGLVHLELFPKILDLDLFWRIAEVQPGEGISGANRGNRVTG